MTTLIYLLKAAACTLAFYAVYRIFLSRLTFFSLNRLYLIITLVLSFVLPAVQYNVTVRQPLTNEAFTADKHDYSNLTTTVTHIEPNTIINQVNLSQYLLYAYLLIVAILAIRLAISVVRLLQAKMHSKPYGSYALVKLDTGLTNCSFFNTIFLKSSLSNAEQQTIIAHEKEHIKRIHSADKLLVEIAAIILWFNPWIYLYKKALHEVHEYEADAALTCNINKKDYADILLKLSGFNGPALVNNFSGSMLNKRVRMLFTPPTKQSKKMVYILVLPFVALLTWFVSVNYVNARNIGISSNTFTVIIDAGHGGKDNGATFSGINEKDLALALAKAVKNIGLASGINIQLTRETDEFVPLTQRVAGKADLFISLHFNNAGGTRSGIMAITSGPANNASNALAGACIAGLGKLKGIATLPAVYNQKIKVLNEAKMPATLLEIGYMSNPEDLQFISNADNQSKIAQGIVDGIKRYKAGNK